MSLISSEIFSSFCEIISVLFKNIQKVTMLNLLFDFFYVVKHRFKKSVIVNVSSEGFPGLNLGEHKGGSSTLITILIVNVFHKY